MAVGCFRQKGDLVRLGPRAHAAEGDAAHEVALFDSGPGSGAHVEYALAGILEILFAHRRALSGHEATSEAWFHSEHVERLLGFLTGDRPIRFVLPAFPAKSANPQKTLGERPDLAEVLALRFLDDLCARIGRLHPPGARLTICSDGRVFSNLVGLREDAVTVYRSELRRLIERHRFAHLDLIDLDQIFPLRDFDVLREELLIRYGQPMEALRRELLSDAPGVALLNGIHRFLMEDLLAVRPELSRSQARQATRGLAYRTIQRSNAWSRAVAERFPDAVRLSIHPQPPRSSKLGLALLPTEDVWRTPWHAVVLDTGREFRLVRRLEAERLDGRLLPWEGQPGYFVAPNVRAQELPL